MYKIRTILWTERTWNKNGMPYLVCKVNKLTVRKPVQHISNQWWSLYTEHWNSFCSSFFCGDGGGGSWQFSALHRVNPLIESTSVLKSMNCRSYGPH